MQCTFCIFEFLHRLFRLKLSLIGNTNPMLSQDKTASNSSFTIMKIPNLICSKLLSFPTRFPIVIQISPKYKIALCPIPKILSTVIFGMFCYLEYEEKLKDEKTINQGWYHFRYEFSITYFSISKF